MRPAPGSHMADHLTQFVKESLEKGESRESIRKVLAAAGWPSDQVRDALNAFADVEFSVPVPRQRRFGSAREAFLYIVYFALLGLVAFYVGQLAFAWIEYGFDDTIFSQSWRSGTRGMRWAVASLLVGYPIFVYLGWRLGDRRRRDSERRTSRVRVWLTYIALVFAATTLIGDLVYVVFRFLAGELGVRFIAKAGVVAAISSTILLNYTREAERVSAGVDWLGRAIAGVTTLVVMVLVFWAFTLINSPFAARAQAADNRRVTDLGTLTRLVDCHRTYIGETPETLAELDENLGAKLAAGEPLARYCEAKTPEDPREDTPYTYRKLDGDQYELCATFERAWPETNDRNQNRRRRIGNRVNGEDRYIELPDQPGETCFDFVALDFTAKDNASE